MFIPIIAPGMILVCVSAVGEKALTDIFMRLLPIIHFQTMRVRRLTLRGTSVKEEEGINYIFAGLNQEVIEQFKQKIQETIDEAWVITAEDFKVHVSRSETQPPEVRLIFYL